MKIYVKFIIMFWSVTIYAQNQQVVRDSITNLPVKYANIWIQNQEVGTTADVDGTFKLEASNNSKIVVSVLGYQTKTVTLKPQMVVLLNPITYQLNEISLKAKKNKNQIEIGKFKKSGIFWYFSSNKPIGYAKFFRQDSIIAKHPFVKQITFYTSSRINNALLKLRFLGVKANGEPAEDINEDIITFSVKKGKRLNKIDVSDYNISIPKEGIFVALEWMIIEQNKYTFQYFKVAEKNKKIYYDGVSYEPLIKINPSEVPTMWRFSGGKWQKQEKDLNSTQYYMKNYSFFTN